MSCASANPTSCSGGVLAFVSTDGMTSMNATFSSGAFVESCSGGGRGGHITCGYTFTGYFQGTSTVNGLGQAITGVTYQGFGTSGAPASGLTAYNSAYSPFYYTDSEQLHRSDDLMGTNQISYGGYGSGVGQFYGANGTALDSAGRIYIADAYNCRIVRIDNMTGANWAAYGGTCGSGQGQFYDPSAVAVDSNGKIYVMDSGNSRVVRIDDMNGANWIAYGSAGSGVGQFALYLASIAVDSSGRIYIPDTGNVRLVRMDDMNGTNWTVLTQSPNINGQVYSFQSPAAVAIDSAGKIYIADNESYQPAVVRVDDMTGANWTYVYVGSSGLNSIAVDYKGTVYAGGGGVRLVDGMAGVLFSSGTIGPIGPSYVFGVTPVPLPSPVPPAITVSTGALSFANQNINTSSVSQPVTINNFGGSPLDFSSITANNGFVDTTTCSSLLVAGSSCTAYVSFAPSTIGQANGLLTFSDNSANLGSRQVVSLSGFATHPAAYVVPGSLTFPGQVLNTASPSQSVVVLNTGTGPLQVSTVTAAPPFSQTNNCSAAIVPGGACTIQVSFTPAAPGSASGTLGISGNAGAQSVTLTGIGSTVAPTVTVAPAGLLFPLELVHSTSAGQKVTITNAGKSAVSISGVTVTGDFAETTTCMASLAAGKSCAVTVTFTPTSKGTRTGVLTVNLPAGVSTVSLAGTGSTAGLPGALSLAPNPVVFTGYIIGDNPVQKVTVTNTSGASVGIAGIAISGDASLTEYNRCPSVLAAGATCTIDVTFRPVANGTFTSTLTLTESSGTKDAVPVSGEAGPSS